MRNPTITRRSKQYQSVATVTGWHVWIDDSYIGYNDADSFVDIVLDNHDRRLTFIGGNVLVFEI